MGCAGDDSNSSYTSLVLSFWAENMGFIQRLQRVLTAQSCQVLLLTGYTLAANTLLTLAFDPICQTSNFILEQQWKFYPVKSFKWPLKNSVSLWPFNCIILFPSRDTNTSLRNRKGFFLRGGRGFTNCDSLRVWLLPLMPVLCLDSSHRPSAQYPGDCTFLQALWGWADPGTLGTAAVGSSLQIAWAAAHWHQQSAPFSAAAETQNYQGRWWSKLKIAQM